MAIHVRPNASKTAVGGTHDGALVVWVAQPADQGKATAAALQAVAEALGVPHRTVTLLHGASSRRKVLQIAVEEPERGSVEDGLAVLRAT